MESERKTYQRLSAAQRFERLVVFVALIGLIFTGIPQKYAGEEWAQSAIIITGGIESTRIIHRFMAVLLMAASLYHVMALIYHRWVLGRLLWSRPFHHALRDLGAQLLHNFGLRASPPPDYRFTLVIQYAVLLLSVLILILTGIMLWDPVAITDVLPGESIPVARSVHSNQALLLVLFIVIWGIFSTLLWGSRRHNLADIPQHTPLPAEVVALRRRLFWPIAAIVSIIIMVGLIRIITSEQTAIDTVPRREAVVFAPQLTTETGDSQVGAALWSTLRCAFCHGAQAEGGLDGQPALRGADITFDAFFQQVRLGTEAMPPFGPEELPDRYLLHLWTWLSESPAQ